MATLPFPDFASDHYPHNMLSYSPAPSPAHSRDSSVTSSISDPSTPTFSTRGHTRWPSSSSSLTTNPESPANPLKSPLHDLVEEPAERDDGGDDPFHHQFDHAPPTDEPLCICDTTWCEHRGRAPSPPFAPSLSTPEWSPGDDYFHDAYIPGQPIVKRRRSDDDAESFSSRISRHFPFSKKFGHRHGTSMSSTIHLRSAPTSRSSSLKLPKSRSFTAPNVHHVASLPSSPASLHHEERSVSPPRARGAPSALSSPMHSSPLETDEEDSMRQDMASTPLLPPMLAEYFTRDSQDALRSPLQSPTVASPSTVPSIVGTPAGTPILAAFSHPPSQPLSTKPSTSSISTRSGTGVRARSETQSPLTIAEETDEWAIKLGHANFHITPEPYLPEVCDAQTCRQLRDDWEAARVEFMRQAARVSEHYGVTSRTYLLTEQKWAEIDAVWRRNLEMANAEARAYGEKSFVQPLAETQALQRMPSLRDPRQPSKFPAVEEADIVGPMVQYAKVQHRRQPTRKYSSFLKLFTSPASLLGVGPNMDTRG